MANKSKYGWCCNCTAGFPVTCVIVSFETHVQEAELPGTDADSDDSIDVFDVTEAEPDMLFVNPFACQVDPLRWQELQV